MSIKLRVLLYAVICGNINKYAVIRGNIKIYAVICCNIETPDISYFPHFNFISD